MNANTEGMSEAQAAHAIPYLNERQFTRGHRVAWIIRKIETGHFVARMTWSADLSPKRLFAYVDCGCLVVTREGGKVERFATFTWADITADDWYVVEQLELTR